MTTDSKAPAIPKAAGILQTFRAVAWSFFGVRRRADLESDAAKLNPVHLILAGLIAAGVFVAGLSLLVQWVISSGVAGG